MMTIRWNFKRNHSRDNFGTSDLFWVFINGFERDGGVFNLHEMLLMVGADCVQPTPMARIIPGTPFGKAKP
jgi:hypothetical protein